MGNQNSLVKYAVEAQRNEVTLCTPFLKGWEWYCKYLVYLLEHSANNSSSALVYLLFFVHSCIVSVYHTGIVFLDDFMGCHSFPFLLIQSLFTNSFPFISFVHLFCLPSCYFSLFKRRNFIRLTSSSFEKMKYYLPKFWNFGLCFYFLVFLF